MIYDEAGLFDYERTTANQPQGAAEATS
ncbi:MAG: hypothetical protein ACJAZ8_002141 [Planctomycetota bacterium]